MRKNIFPGFLLIFLGSIFLFINLGYLRWDIWQVIFELWPVFLIALGIHLLFRRNIFVQLLIIVLVFVIPLLIYYNGGQIPYVQWEAGPGKYENVNWSLANQQKTKVAKLDLRIGAGEIKVSPTDEFISLAAATYSGQPQIDIVESENQSNIKIRQNREKSVWPFYRQKEEWQVGLGKETLWDIKLSTGAGRGELDFREVSFNNLKVDMGAGDFKFLFGQNTNDASVDIDGGAGNITLIIPPEVGVQAKIHMGVGDKELSGRAFEQNGDRHTSANFAEAKVKLNITIDSGVGKVSIRTP